MKIKEKQALREKTAAQLEKLVEAETKKLVESRIKMAKRQLKNTRQPARIKNKIAVIKTLIREKQLEREA